MSENPPDELLLQEIQGYLLLLEDGFIEHLKPLEQASVRTNLLRLLEIWHQVYLRRMFDLASAAHDMINLGRLVPSCTLIRSGVETIGTFYYVNKKITEFTDKSDFVAIHHLLMSAVFGRKDFDPEIKPIQILTAIDHLDKEFLGFRDLYDHLSEYAHPNANGGLGSYGSPKGELLEIEFGSTPLSISMLSAAIFSLHLALRVAKEVNNSWRSFQPEVLYMIEKNAPNYPS
jgi:hypothetical protein